MRPLLFALACLTLHACAGEEDSGAGAGGPSLLARRPDAVHWQAGELVVDAKKRWGDLGQFGWADATSEHDGRAFLWTTREKAFLRLPCGPKAERNITLTVLGPPGKKLDVAVTLNGTVLTTLHVTEQANEYPVHAPQSAWIEGDNLLELDLPRQADGTKPAVGLARVAYGERREVEVQPEKRRVLLEPGTSVGYRIEPLSASRVLLGAHASGPGTLTATLVGVDPETGKDVGGDPQPIDVTGAMDLERAFALPADGRLYELRLAWAKKPGAADTELELSRLDVQETQPVARPSIVLISVDTLSARHLSLHGYPLATSPALERMAAESFVFDSCMTNAPWTLPSFMSLMSGLYANASRLESSGTELYENWYLSQNRWTMAEFLRAAGYRTAGFVDNAWITEKFGFPQGFDVYDASAANNNSEKAHDPDGGIRQTTAEARRFLDHVRPEDPFFLFVHCFDVHAPYAPPAPFDGRFDDAPIYDRERTALAGGPANVYGIIPTYVARGEVPEGAIPPSMHTAPIEGAYDESIQFVDEELGKFFDDLRARGVLDRAWLIVTADHGETMADTPYYFGHGVLDQDVVHIPLLVRPPGGKPGGARVQETVQLADLYPTFLELLGRPRREYLHGRSLLPILEDGQRESSVVLTESGPMRQAMLIADGWKLVELEVSKDVQAQALLSHPSLTPEWFAIAERGGKERQAKYQGNATGTTPEQRDDRFFGWYKDEDLKRDVFERLPRTGLTEELMADMRSRKEFKSLLAFLKRALEAPTYELYDLEHDPNARHNVVDQHPERKARMMALLANEKAKRIKATGNALPPTTPVELDAEAKDELNALGYGGDAGKEASEPATGKEQAQSKEQSATLLADMTARATAASSLEALETVRAEALKVQRQMTKEHLEALRSVIQARKRELTTNRPVESSAPKE